MFKVCSDYVVLLLRRRRCAGCLRQLALCPRLCMHACISPCTRRRSQAFTVVKPSLCHLYRRTYFKAYSHTYCCFEGRPLTAPFVAQEGLQHVAKLQHEVQYYQLELYNLQNACAWEIQQRDAHIASLQETVQATQSACVQLAAESQERAVRVAQLESQVRGRSAYLSLARNTSASGCMRLVS